MPSERRAVVRWIKGARRVAVCLVDIAVFKAATVYHVNGLPYRDEIGKLVDRYAKKHDRPRPATPLLIESAAAGSNEALVMLRLEHPTLSFERDASGALLIRARSLSI